MNRNQYNMAQYFYGESSSSNYHTNSHYDQGNYQYDRYQHQNYNNYGNEASYNNQNHTRNQATNYNRSNNNNYKQNFPALQQNGQNYHHQNYQQQQQQRKWGNNNNNNRNMMKRSHEYVDQSLTPSTSSSSISQTASPEPKRQLQNFQQHLHQAAYQTQPQPANVPPWKQQQQQQQSPQRRKKGGNGNNILENFHEQRVKEWTEMFDRTMKLLSECRAGEEIAILVQNLQPDKKTWNKTKEQIFNDLSKVMTPMGLEKLLVFGSTLTGLDFYGSDLDFFIQLKKIPSNEEEIKDAIKRAAKMTRYLQGHDFYVICTIPNARVPLIRLMHKNSRVTCDVNFNSRFGYYNSYFIGHILGYDKRIKDLAIILKLWSKAYKIASQMILSNYCLMMLLIFYLQNIENPMLDTIYNNQRSRSAMILDLSYKWNFYFNDNINNTCHNHQSLRELLTGFFNFYEKINFKDYVISIYTGTLIKRTDFDTLPELENFRNLIKTHNLTPLKVDNADTYTIQDGFELNLNIGTKVKKHTDALQEYIKLSHDKCIELKDKPFAEFLVKLYTDIKVASKKEQNEGKSKNKKKFQMKIHSIAGDLKMCQDILTSQHQDKDKIYTVEDQQKFFYNHVVEYTSKFLKEIYLCTIVPEILDETPANAMQTRFKVIQKIDTINGRKKMVFKDDESLEGEKVLSTKMMEKRIPMDLDILLGISSLDKGKTIDIDMFDNSNSGKKSSLLAFGNYFSINITLALKYYLKRRWDEIIVFIFAMDFNRFKWKLAGLLYRFEQRNIALDTAFKLEEQKLDNFVKTFLKQKRMKHFHESSPYPLEASYYHSSTAMFDKENTGDGTPTSTKPAKFRRKLADIGNTTHTDESHCSLMKFNTIQHASEDEEEEIIVIEPKWCKKAAKMARYQGFCNLDLCSTLFVNYPSVDIIKIFQK